MRSSEIASVHDGQASAGVASSMFEDLRCKVWTVGGFPHPTASKPIEKMLGGVATGQMH